MQAHLSTGRECEWKEMIWDCISHGELTSVELLKGYIWPPCMPANLSSKKHIFFSTSCFSSYRFTFMNKNPQYTLETRLLLSANQDHPLGNREFIFLFLLCNKEHSVSDQLKWKNVYYTIKLSCWGNVSDGWNFLRKTWDQMKLSWLGVLVQTDSRVRFA